MTTEDFNNAIEKLSCGDCTALEKIYQEYYSMIYLTAYSIVKNKSDAEDVAMETILKLGKLKNGEPVKNPCGYLYVLASNSAKDCLRKKRDVPLDAIQNEPANTDDFSKVYVGDIISALSDPEREIVIEHIYGEFRFREIAAARKLSVATVKRKYKEACKKLKKLLNEN